MLYQKVRTKLSTKKGTVPFFGGMLEFSAIVDLDRYPIADLEGAEGRSFARASRERYAAEGVLVLSDFLTPHGLDLLAAEARGAAPTWCYSKDIARCTGSAQWPVVAPG